MNLNEFLFFKFLIKEHQRILSKSTCFDSEGFLHRQIKRLEGISEIKNVRPLSGLYFYNLN